jgi:hypothetical protein
LFTDSLAPLKPSLHIGAFPVPKPVEVRHKFFPGRHLGVRYLGIKKFDNFSGIPGFTLLADANIL